MKKYIIDNKTVLKTERIDFLKKIIIRNQVSNLEKIDLKNIKTCELS